MCLKNKIISVALCAIAAVAGMFVTGTDTAQAESLTTTSTAGMSLEQMQQLIMKLQEQIAYIIQLLVQQQKPVCGNGVCETAKGETAANCPKDCGTASVCGRTDLIASDGARCTAAGGTISCPNTACSSQDTNCIGAKCTCNCPSACTKEGAACSFYKCGATDTGTGTSADAKCIGGGSTCCAGLTCKYVSSDSTPVCVKDATCTPEGKVNYFGSPACCNGLTSVTNATPSGDLCAATNNGASVCTKCGNGICGLGENKCNCPADCGQITDKGKAKCVATGGGWNYSDCASGCVFNTKSERLNSEGMACAAVCLKDYKCDCPSGKYWASREEGCVTNSCAGENETITTSKPECCTGLERKYAYYDDCAVGQDCIGTLGRTICIKPTTCTPEGKVKEMNGPVCCSGLTSVLNCGDDNTLGCPNNGSARCVRCGNGICGLGENILNCPKDCGASTCGGENQSRYNSDGSLRNCCAGLIAVSYVGGNSNAEPGTASAYLAQVCTKCGNGICSQGENSTNCPTDCYTNNTKCTTDSDCTSSCGGCYNRTWAMAVDCAESPTYWRETFSCKCVAGACQKSTATCTETCRAKGYGSSYCNAWGVTQYSTPGNCGANEFNAGWTSDCTAANIAGGGRACCCANNITPINTCNSNLPYGTCIETGGIWTCSSFTGACSCGCPATCSSSAGCGSGSTVVTTPQNTSYYQ